MYVCDIWDLSEDLIVGDRWLWCICLSRPTALCLHYPLLVHVPRATSFGLATHSHSHSTSHEPRRTHSVKSRDRRGGRAPRRVKNARVCVGVCVCRSGRRGRRSGAGLARPPAGLGSAWGTELLSSLSSDTSPPPASYDQQAHGANNDSCNNVSEHAGHQ
jgi:hypothetical protein